MFSRVPPDIAHVVAFQRSCDEPLVVPPRSAACAEGAFLGSDMFRSGSIVLPYGDEAFGKHEEQRAEDDLVFSDKVIFLEQPVIVVADVRVNLS